PTEPNLSRSDNPKSQLPNPNIWYVRYRNQDGRWRKARLTTGQLRLRLRQGRLSSTCAASHLLVGKYRPLNAYPEFRTVKLVAKKLSAANCNAATNPTKIAKTEQPA